MYHNCNFLRMFTALIALLLVIQIRSNFGSRLPSAWHVTPTATQQPLCGILAVSKRLLPGLRRPCDRRWSLCLRLLLLVSGNVETNPGPLDTSSSGSHHISNLLTASTLDCSQRCCKCLTRACINCRCTKQGRPCNLADSAITAITLQESRQLVFYPN